jgi:hypothetical protein
MDRSRRRLVLIWLATTAAAVVALLVVYGAVVGVPELAGRTEPETLLEQPESLFADPGMLGTAIEIRVTRTIAACMEARGFKYRGPAAVDGLEETLDPAVDGYGIATGPAGGEVLLGEGGPTVFERDAYEQALYGAGLAGAGDPGGCAAVGAAELQASLATLQSLPYSIEQLEADARNHPEMAAGLSGWSACMAAKGYTAAAPEDLIADLADRLSRAGPDEARALAEEERRTASDDFACRSEHLDPATEAVAAELAPAFVAANREQLEELMPPEPAAIGPGVIPEGLGTGDIQVTLIWTAAVDLDLAATDPAGANINYGNKTSPSGGRLDRDANFPCTNIEPNPVENIFWPEGGAPRGSYRVFVRYQSSCGSAGDVGFRLIVQVGGSVVIDEQRTLGPRSTFETEFGF